MALTRIERIMGRRQVNAVIKADPVNLVFERTAMETLSDNSRKKGASTPLEPQECILIPFKRRLTESVVNTEFGAVSNLPYVLIGRYDLDIEEGDVFTWDGNKFEVVSLDLKTEQHVVAQIDYFGRPNRG